MQWSKFIHLLKIDNKSILFHAINKKIFILTEDISICEGDGLPSLACINDKALVVLKKNEFIFEFEENLNLLEINNSPKISLENLRMLVTNKCNLNCSYCQIERNIADSSAMGMSISTAKDVINWFSRSYNKMSKPSITITGGEPFTNYEVFKFIVQYAKEKCPSARLTLFTNGTLIDPVSAKFLKDNNVFVLISIDGSEEIHNKDRVAFDNSNSFSMTMRGYEYLKDENVKFGISAVMPESYDDFTKMIEFFCSLKPLSVGINYRHQLLNSCFEVDFEEHGKRIIQAFDLFNSEGIYFENYERYRKSFISEKLRTRECQSCGRGITVDPRGYVGTCKSLLVSDLNMCNFDNFNYYESEMVLNWASRTPLADDECKVCYAISICGGGCAYDSYVIYDGDYKKCDKRICPFMKQVTKKLLLDVIKQYGASDGNIILTLEDNLIDPMIQSVGH